MENTIKMDDLGVPLFLETPISGRFTIQLESLCIPLPSGGSQAHSGSNHLFNIFLFDTT